jgi:hypothetical protein
LLHENYIGRAARVAARDPPRARWNLLRLCRL